MKPPDQPSRLRLLHAITAAAVCLAWFSGLALHGRYDGRLFRWPALGPGNLWDLHKLAGTALLPAAILLLLYALSLRRWRLRNPAYSVMILALALPLLIGQDMHRRWLLEGQSDHLIYKFHPLGCSWPPRLTIPAESSSCGGA